MAPHGGPSTLDDCATADDDRTVLGSVLDVFRLRQYFDVAARTRELAGDVLSDLGFLDLARRSLVRLPGYLYPV